MTVIHVDALGMVAQVTFDWSVNVSNVLSAGGVVTTVIVGFWNVAMRLRLLERDTALNTKRLDVHGERIDEMIEAIAELKGMAISARRDIDRLNDRGDYRSMGVHGD